jgi:hypothetical protein
MPVTPALPTAPLINGRRFSYSSIEMNFLAGVFVGRIIDIDEITYSEQLDIGFRRGTSKIPLGSTSGIWEPQEGSFSIGKSTFTAFMAAIAATSGQWLGQNFVLNVNYNDEGEALTTDVLTGRFTGQENAHAHSADALKMTIKFMLVIPVVTNGIPSVLAV